MKILVTGAGGQLGRELMDAIAARGYQPYGFDRHTLDITDSDMCLKAIRDVRPDAVIHCAAYTAVDKAESDEEEAYKVNAIGTRNVAAAAENVGSTCCYISTDYVFDGRKDRPYHEFERPNPQTVYGKSKLEGEVLLRSLCRKWFVVRTAWVYGRYGQNFVKTMLALALEKESLHVVHDQIGAPTYTKDLSGFLLDLVQTEKYGIYHATNGGSCTWFEFAKEIYRLCGIRTELRPCKSEDFTRPAPRPHYSVLDHMGIRLNGMKGLRPWHEALEEFLEEYQKEPH